MKVAINRCFGGFGVSKDVYDELELEWDKYGYLENKDFGIEDDDYKAYRSHPKLIAAIEKIGEKKASNNFANIKIVTIPDGIEWTIEDYDGQESIHERHRSW